MAGPVYTLERLVWRRHADRWLVLPGADPVRTFADRATAEATAREREWEIRRRVNPFRCGGPRLHYQTAFDAARLYDWCLDHGLDPPGVTPESGPWAKWWDDHQRHFSDIQRAAVWEVLDRVRFFRVTESKPSEPMHLVALPHHELDPITFNLFGRRRYVGGTPFMLVRSLATADAMCDDLHVTREAQLGQYADRRRAVSSWAVADFDPFAERDETADPHESDPSGYVEHRPLALWGDRPPTPGRDVFVVLRRSWRLKEGPHGSWYWSGTETKTCGRAVAAFGTLAAADAHVARLEAEARDYPSPFRFGSHLEWGRLDASAAFGVLSELAPLNHFATLWNDYKPPDRLWNEWWDAARPGLSAEQVETAWGLFEKLKFYEVVAVEFRE